MLKDLSDDERIELKATLKQKNVHSTKWLDIGVALIMFALAFVSSIAAFHIPYFFSWSEFKVLLALYGVMLFEHMKCKYTEGKYVKTLTYLEEFEKSLTK